MPAEQPRMNAQERLAISRHALVSQLQGGHEAAPEGHRRSSLLEGIEWMPMARAVAQHWWQRHPVHAAGQLALPVLQRYANQEPLKLVAAAAAIGAVVVLARPWRLLSTSLVLATLFKTSDVAGVVTTLMQRKTSPRKESP